MPFFSWENIIKDIEPNETLPSCMTRQGIVMGSVMFALHEVIAGKDDAGSESPAPLSHSHESEQITYVFEGRMKMKIGSEVRELGPHDFAHIPSHVVHGIEALTDYVKALDIWCPPRPDVVKRVEGVERRSRLDQ